eukprot:NODE_686_length_4746_cov_0.370562.p4 type:complete len:133 gc:universal NODE_686_length_4746_cov_0.370562:1228-830(-)
MFLLVTNVLCVSISDLPPVLTKKITDLEQSIPQMNLVCERKGNLARENINLQFILGGSPNDIGGKPLWYKHHRQSGNNYFTNEEVNEKHYVWTTLDEQGRTIFYSKNSNGPKSLALDFNGFTCYSIFHSIFN